MDLSQFDMMYIYIALAMIGVWFVVKVVRKIVAFAFTLLSLYKLATWHMLIN